MEKQLFFGKDYSLVSDSGRYSRFMDALEKSLKQQQPVSRLSLLPLLKDDTKEGPERRKFKAKHRELLQHELIATRLERVLANSNIAENKAHYLYFLRMYEWRLNDQRLLY